MQWNEVAGKHLLPYLNFRAKFIWQDGKLSRVFLTMDAPSLEIEGSKKEIELTLEWIKSYFCGMPTSLPLKKADRPFQQEVCEALLETEFGKTLSYSDLAKFVGRERAVRAVGTACGRNHLPLVIPCHRVISKTGSIGGFSIDIRIKQYLLELEDEIQNAIVK